MAIRMEPYANICPNVTTMHLPNNMVAVPASLFGNFLLTEGLLIDDPQFVSMVSSLVSFPLLYLSNVLVDPGTIPEFLQKFVSINPVSLTSNAVRGLMHGNVTTFHIAIEFLSCSLLIMIFGPLTMVLHDNKNAD